MGHHREHAGSDRIPTEIRISLELLNSRTARLFPVQLSNALRGQRILCPNPCCEGKEFNLSDDYHRRHFGMGQSDTIRGKRWYVIKFREDWKAVTCTLHP